YTHCVEAAPQLPAQGGGSVAARTIGLAAELVAMVARRSGDSWPDAPGVAAQAVELAERCPRLAEDDAKVWQAALSALSTASEETDGARDAALGHLLAGSAELPVSIAEIGADVAVLAALSAKLGDGTYRSDAVSAAMLAHAGARVAVHLVTVNLGTRDGDERPRRAAGAEWRAE